MQRARWSTAIAAAALIALPVAASAQSTHSAPPQNLPAQQQPQQQPPAQPPSSTSQPPPSTSQPPPSTSQPQPPASAQPTAQPPAGHVDPGAAKTHLSAARDTLSQLTSLPEAARLQGEARTQVSQLISNFNALITTQADWRAAYSKVDENLTSLLGPDAGDQPVGTSGAAAGSGSIQVDPAIRAKLVEFRSHLKEFEKAAGGPAPAAAAEAMPPSVATPSTSNPASPSNPNPSSPSNPNPGNPTGTGGVTPSSPTANMAPADREQAAGQVNAAAQADAQKELDAISAILSRSKTGALTRAQTAQLKKHVETLRTLLAQR